MKLLKTYCNVFSNFKIIKIESSYDYNGKRKRAGNSK